jgi:hypothetical protein
MGVGLWGCKDGGDKTEDKQGSERDRVQWSKSLQEPNKLQKVYLENLRWERLAKENMCLERAETSVSQLKP